MRECHAWMNATIKHGQKMDRKVIGGWPHNREAKWRLQGTKMVNQLEGSWPANGTFQRARRWPVAWVDRLRDSFCWFVVVPEKGSGATGFADFFAQVYHCQCHIVHHMPVILGGWMAQWLAWIRMDGWILLGTVFYMFHPNLEVPGLSVLIPHYGESILAPASGEQAWIMIDSLMFQEW